ncbi:uncharacterized protein BO95DRAFT_73444 [Aspergillus brunneoviolaceus CBS 621.78]|uniref:Uncharacterized protein n=1 Tax=Aspergillus brunneoviolaceus CBS 621.78 TaxID=1450534 RepID=A0ACD1GEW7_9EURO|nr:hypothetical protein BO95DRAFT_73444 [Aspergillus brunneoviolaceus CBS 621.78]RAH47710.1 hypothetical protein BO95DRAFT_73444 [Aspergillus brunneoviolaceus CBS 621.78]
MMLESIQALMIFQPCWGCLGAVMPRCLSAMPRFYLDALVPCCLPELLAHAPVDLVRLTGHLSGTIRQPPC